MCLWQKWHYAAPEVRWQKTIQVLSGSLQTLALELSHRVIRRRNRGPRLQPHLSHSSQQGPTWQSVMDLQKDAQPPWNCPSDAMRSRTAEPARLCPKGRFLSKINECYFKSPSLELVCNTDRRQIHIILLHSVTKCCCFFLTTLFPKRNANAREGDFHIRWHFFDMVCAQLVFFIHPSFLCLGLCLKMIWSESYKSHIARY